MCISRYTRWYMHCWITLHRGRYKVGCSAKLSTWKSTLCNTEHVHYTSMFRFNNLFIPLTLIQTQNSIIYHIQYNISPYAQNPPYPHQPFTPPKRTPIYSTNSMPAHLLISKTPTIRPIRWRSPIMPPLILVSRRRHKLLTLLHRRRSMRVRSMSWRVVSRSLLVLWRERRPLLLLLPVLCAGFLELFLLSEGGVLVT